MLGLNENADTPRKTGPGQAPARGAPGLAGRVAQWRSVVVLLAFVVGMLGTGIAVGLLFPPGGWYQELAKPTWNPPNWLFGPVWTAVYVLIGTSAWLVWRERRAPGKERSHAWLAFVVQAVLNFAWTPLFFGLRQPGLAFLDISLLWLAVLWTTLVFGRIRPLAGYLMIPYVLWVSFALVLNGTIWLMNT